MTNLFDYEILLKDTFYRTHHILRWIELHPNMDEIDKEAIKATIMDALVYHKLINPKTDFLDFENLCIINNPKNKDKYYQYEINPNICGFPMWMKERFRRKCIEICGGQPISIFLAKPASRISNYCVYDPNEAVSSIFKDANFIEASYNSPTRKGIFVSKRPFVEVIINNEKYLVDILTKRILKTRWFVEKYDMKVLESIKISEFSVAKKKKYKEDIKTKILFGSSIPLMELILNTDNDSLAEMKFELEQSKKYFPRAWKDKERFEKLMTLSNEDLYKATRKYPHLYHLLTSIQNSRFVNEILKLKKY